jgi:hypothetical protein
MRNLEQSFRYYKSGKPPFIKISRLEYFVIDVKVEFIIARIRSVMKYKWWRDSVLTRDEYKCWYSGLFCKFPEAHHNKAFNRIIKQYHIKSIEQALECAELWDVDNGLCMEKVIHRAHHDIWGW